MPRVVDHDQRRRELALAACDVIARAGLEGATLRDVARQAGCTTGRVSHYFADKQQLLLAALETATQAVEDRILHRALADPGDLRGILTESLPLDEPRRIEWRIWIAFWGAAIGDPDLHREHRGRYDTWRDALVTVLAQTPVPVAARADTAETLMIAVDGIGVHATFDVAHWPPHRQLAHLDQALATALATARAAAPDQGVLG